MGLRPHLCDLAYAHSPPGCAARLRAALEDFRVEEHLPFEPSGRGQHVWLRVRKRDLNTEDVARALARRLNVARHAIGYAGLKDRRAVATQWFSVDVGEGREEDWSAALPPGGELLRALRHDRKLRRGAFARNAFRIVLSDLAGDPEEVDERLERVRERGAPNYFGEQRFGRGEGNLDSAARLLEGELRVRDRHRRGLLLSAARSYLFNACTSARVEHGTWDRALPGDVLMLEGTHSTFPIEVPDGEIETRLARGDLHPTAPLWGAGGLPTHLDARAFEEQVLAPFERWRAGLERFGLSQERRAARVMVRDLRWRREVGGVVVEFSLPGGSYATSVLREVVRFL